MQANATVLGISHDTPADLKTWRADRKLQYDLLSDVGYKIHQEWGAKSKVLGALSISYTNRSFFVVDENGIVISAQVGVGPTESAEKALEVVRASQSASA